MAKLGDAWEFQQQTLAGLRRESFSQLSNRPAREQLPTPSHLRGLKIFVCRSAGERGGVEISVEVQRRSLAVFTLKSVDGFEMLRDGKIVPFDDGQYDGD